MKFFLLIRKKLPNKKPNLSKSHPNGSLSLPNSKKESISKKLPSLYGNKLTISKNTTDAKWSTWNSTQTPTLNFVSHSKDWPKWSKQFNKALIKHKILQKNRQFK
jgi:hypothetical protein